MAQSMRVFTLTRNEQKGSRLAQLPPELRLKILRNLLKAGTPLPNEMLLLLVDGKDDTIAPQICGDDTQLSAQLLLVCQKFHEDAFEVLYGENVLTMCVVHASRILSGEGSSVTILNRTLALKDDYKSVLTRSLRRLKKTPDSFAKSIIRRADGSWLGWTSAIKFMRNIELTIFTDHKDVLTLICLSLKAVIDNKAVTIKQGPVTQHSISKNLLRLSAHDFAACHFLRSSSLRIELRGGGDEVDLAILRDIQQTAPSNVPPPDLFTSWNNLYALNEAHVRCYDKTAKQRLASRIQELGVIALRLEDEKYWGLLPEVKEAMREAAASRAQRLAEEIIKAKASLKALDDALTNCKD